MAEAEVEDVYPAIYYQTIRDLGIDPVVCGDLRVSVGIGPEGCTEVGSAGRGGGSRPVQLADKALAKASGGSARVPRKRAPRKATGAGAEARAGAVVTKPAKMANAKVPASVPAQGVGPAKTARGTAKVASSE